MAPTWTQLIYGISIGTIAYTGIETVSNMAEEAANPGKDVPRVVNFVLIAVLAVYTGMSLVGLTAMPVRQRAARTTRRRVMTVPVQGRPDRPGRTGPNGPWVFADNRALQIHVYVTRDLAPVASTRLHRGPEAQSPSPSRSTGAG